MDPFHADKYANATSLFVPVDWVPVDAGDAPETLERPGRAIRAVGAGTVTITVADGTERTLAFASGETRWIVVKSIVSMSGVTAVEVAI